MEDEMVKDIQEHLMGIEIGSGPEDFLDIELIKNVSLFIPRMKKFQRLKEDNWV
jgi:hypothetical protein